MHSRTWTTLVLLMVTGCSSGTDDGGDGITETVSIAGGGFSDTGVFGFGGLDLPDLWSHMFGRAQEGDPDRECRDQHRCGVGGVVDAFGLLTGLNGKFAVVTTGDFRCTTNDFDDCADNDVTVLVSGVQTFPATVATPDNQVWTSATIIFNHALLSGRANPAGAADSVVVNVLPTGGAPTRVLKLTAADLGTTLSLQGSSCGTQPLPALDGAETTYPSCSEWSERRVDLTPFLGQEVSLQFIAGEAGAAIALAFDDLRIEVSR